MEGDWVDSSFQYLISEFNDKELLDGSRLVQNDPSNRVLAVKLGDQISIFNLKKGFCICWSHCDKDQDDGSETISFSTISSSSIHIWKISFSTDDISQISSININDLVASSPENLSCPNQNTTSLKVVHLYRDRAVYLYGQWLLCFNIHLKDGLLTSRKILHNKEVLIQVVPHDLELRYQFPLSKFDFPGSAILSSVLFSLSPDGRTLYYSFLSNLFFLDLTKLSFTNAPSKPLTLIKRSTSQIINPKSTQNQRWRNKLSAKLPPVKVTGFTKRDTRVLSQASAVSGCDVVFLPEDIKEMRIIELQALVGGCLFHTSDKEKQVLVYVEMIEPRIITHRVEVECRILLPKSCFSAPVILSEKGISGVAFNTSQEHLVNKLMLYSSAASAETLCRINAWDKCSIPMHTLQVGLKNRQMDTVTFFLKSRENIFSLPKDVSLHALTENDIAYHALDLEQMSEVINLLTSSIGHHINDTQSKQFAEHLLVITLNHLNIVVKGIVSKQKTVESIGMASVQFQKDTTQILSVMTEYIIKLRTFLSRGPSSQTPSSAVPLNSWMSEAQERLLAVWGSLDQKAATIEALLNGQLPLIQAHLSERFGKKAAHIETIIAYGLDETISLLHDRDMNQASRLLINMGYDTESKLKEICMHTADRQLRLYLSYYLNANGSLTNEELAMVDYLQQLEAVYSCASFEMAKSLRTESRSKKWEDSVDLCALMPAPKSTITDECGELYPVEVSNSETAAYSDVLLNWVAHWDADTRSRVIADQVLFQSEKNAAAYSQVLTPSVIWGYLCDHLDVARLEEWINHQYPLQPSGNSAVPWPYNLAIMDDMLLMLDRCPLHIKDDLLDLLASRGIWTSTESSSFPLLLRRLSHLCISFSPQMKSGNDRQTAFHRNVIELTQKENLPELLYYYLLNSGLSNSAIEDVLPASISPWFKALLHIRQISSSVSDPTSVFEAGVALHQHLCNERFSVQDDLKPMLNSKYIRRLLALLSFSPSHFEEIFCDPSSLDALVEYPRIQRAIACRNEDRVVKQDLTVYQLLQGNGPFDPSRLFGWQRANTLATQEAPKEIPHFASESLAKSYACKQSLSHTYFLKQGRPSYAMCAFLHQQLLMGNHRLSHNSIQNVCDRATVLAIKNFLNPVVTSSCVAFIEMMGGDSSWSRLYLQSANQLWAHQHACNVIGGNLEKRRNSETLLRKHIVTMFLRCMQQHYQTQCEIASLLQSAINWTISKQNIKPTSYEASQLWMLSYLFTRGHHLRPCTIFLTECAKVDNWLMFVSYAQMMQYSVDELRGLIERFSSCHLREHLRHLLDHIVHMDHTRSLSMSPTPDNAPSNPRESRDFRAQLYAKIGLHQTKQQVLLPDDFSTKSTFFEIILFCEDQPLPWRCLCAAAYRCSYPELAVIAQGYENSQSLTCLSTWLVVSSTPQVLAIFTEKFSPLESKIWSLESVLDLMEILIQKDLCQILLRGIKMMQPEDECLASFLRFNESVERFENPDEINKCLAKFQEDYQKLEQNSEFSQLSTKAVIESIASFVITHFFKTEKCRIKVRKFLQYLDKCKIMRPLLSRVIDIELLHKIHCIAGHLEVPLNSLILGGDQSIPEFLAACQDVLVHLEKLSAYQEARVFSTLTNQDVDSVTIHELQNELNLLKGSRSWSTIEMREQFWKHCHDCMLRHQMAALNAASFFQEHAALTTEASERSHILQLALDWLNEEQHSHQRHFIFCELWRSKIQHCIQAKSQNSWKIKSKWTIDKNNLLSIVNTRNMAAVKAASLSEEESKTLDILIEDLLNCGQISTAREVVSHFKYDNRDLDIITSCVLMARGLLQPEGLEPHLKQLLTSTPSVRKLRRISSTTLVSLPRKPSQLSISSQAQMAIDTEWEEVNEIKLCTIRALGQHCSAGERAIQLIITAYQICVTLLHTFDWVLETETFTMLHDLLCSDVKQRFVLAKSFILHSGVSDEQVSGFFSDVVLRELKILSGLSSSVEPPDTMILKGGFDANRTVSENRTSSCMTELIQLCQDPAVMGQRLLDMVVSLHSVNAEITKQRDIGIHDVLSKVMMIEVELLIYAHDCFTLACHMEGISSLLHTARAVTMALCQAKEFNLMVHLLTGVARYTEMTYIFELLKENHQFESLFMKGIARDNQLRVAVMDYLNRYHQDDRDLQKVVSFRFTRFREIASLLCEDAHRALRSVASDRSFGNNCDTIDYRKFIKPEVNLFTCVNKLVVQNESCCKYKVALTLLFPDNKPATQQTLQMALDALNDAAESYARESCLRHAQQCSKQAKMVALQLQLLPTKTKIIGLDCASLQSFLEKHPKMTEALVVCEGYGQHNLWTEALYSQVIGHNNLTYLQEFCNHRHLTSSLIADIAVKFQADSSSKPKTATAAMKKILAHCTDIAQRYQLNSSLGFDEDFSQDDVMAYLRDHNVLNDN
ncbi:hypothetical protein CAPTEDRAFT_221770 [Capitella teleta]|uniref:Spatacsin C-terminal domain-containing protein n=1 Tax=Capitella teleta TaxID=283909 RepID=R7T6W5_CAPTE|nr:hypothetical protein CAPTEDRAFT_221770 [Capitella teleta]|eukprot:ELT89138.1 hypothetical protein CAPTEDRAFT_221770 [Capitella teleta]